jgi:GT2 family glycosyltransferase
VVERRYPWVKAIRSETNLGFAGGVRLGVEASSGEVVVLLNDDAAAEPGLVEAHLEVLAGNPRAAASAGRLVSWDGSTHDFLRGAMTFDGHAFQIGQGCAIGTVEPPRAGEPVPFACGGNMAIRREDWQRSGGFDPHLFAYFEDVELGWRLWAAGREVVSAPEALARHRGAATSSSLGDYRRGVLYERNALRVFFATADDECRGAFAPAVLATFLHRMAEFSKEQPELEHAVADPFGDAAKPPTAARRWRQRLQERGVASTVRHLTARLLLGPRAGRPVLEDGLLLMQLRAARGFVDGLEATAARRTELEAIRTIPDRELAARFPRLVVPTYRGDTGWFASNGFRSLLPADGWPLEYRTLDEIMNL